MMVGPHGHSHEVARDKLRLAFFLTAAILIVEVTIGILSNSLAVLSDAGHVLTDIFALGLAWFASVQAGRPADAANTYGYHRTGILAALLNAITLLAIVAAIAYEAVLRFQHAQHVTAPLLFIAATAAIGVNLYIAASLREAGGENLNVRAALMHVLGDVAAAAGVMVAAVVILIAGWYPIDPLLSLAIALLIARGAWSILRDTIDILMEATPKGLNVAQMVRDMVRQPGVHDVHDLHVWSIAGGVTALSAHVQVADQSLSECDGMVAGLSQMLRQSYHIAHATIQLECAGCDTTHLYCDIRPKGAAASHSHDAPNVGADTQHGIVSSGNP